MERQKVAQEARLRWVKAKEYCMAKKGRDDETCQDEGSLERLQDFRIPPLHTPAGMGMVKGSVRKKRAQCSWGFCYIKQT